VYKRQPSQQSIKILEFEIFNNKEVEYFPSLGIAP